MVMPQRRGKDVTIAKLARSEFTFRYTAMGEKVDAGEVHAHIDSDIEFTHW